MPLFSKDNLTKAKDAYLKESWAPSVYCNEILTALNVCIAEKDSRMLYGYQWPREAHEYLLTQLASNQKLLPHLQEVYHDMIAAVYVAKDYYQSFPHGKSYMPILEQPYVYQDLLPLLIKDPTSEHILAGIFTHLKHQLTMTSGMFEDPFIYSSFSIHRFITVLNTVSIKENSRKRTPHIYRGNLYEPHLGNTKYPYLLEVSDVEALQAAFGSVSSKDTSTDPYQIKLMSDAQETLSDSNKNFLYLERDRNGISYRCLDPVDNKEKSSFVPWQTFIDYGLMAPDLNSRPKNNQLGELKKIEKPILEITARRRHTRSEFTVIRNIFRELFENESESAFFTALFEKGYARFGLPDWSEVRSFFTTMKENPDLRPSVDGALWLLLRRKPSARLLNELGDARDDDCYEGVTNELIDRLKYRDSKYFVGSRTEHRESFLSHLKSLKNSTDPSSKKERFCTIEKAVKTHLSLWLGENPYSLEPRKEAFQEDLPQADRQLPLMTARVPWDDEYFWACADFNPRSTMEKVFLPMFENHLLNKKTMSDQDRDAFNTFCRRYPHLASQVEEKYVALLEKGALTGEQVSFVDSFVPLILAHQLAGTHVLQGSELNKSEGQLAGAMHHGPYVILALSAAAGMALSGNWFGVAAWLAVMVDKNTHQIEQVLKAFEELVHVIKGAMHGAEWQAGHSPLPRLNTFSKWVFGVEADTEQMIKHVNNSLSESMKDPANIKQFAKYLVKHIPSALPLLPLKHIKDEHHTHIKDIKTLTAFFLCLSCMRLGYLPKAAHVARTDDQFLNQMIFTAAYLGPSLEHIRSFVGPKTDAERPKLRRGWITANYENNAGETIKLRWCWHRDMNITVEPINGNGPITLAFDTNDPSTVEHPAAEFEIELLKASMEIADNARLDNQKIGHLPGVTFNHVVRPELTATKIIPEFAFGKDLIEELSVESLGNFRDLPIGSSITRDPFKPTEQRMIEAESKIAHLQEENKTFKIRLDNAENRADAAEDKFEKAQETIGKQGAAISGLLTFIEKRTPVEDQDARDELEELRVKLNQDTQPPQEASKTQHPLPTHLSTNPHGTFSGSSTSSSAPAPALPSSPVLGGR